MSLAIATLSALSSTILPACPQSADFGPSVIVAASQFSGDTYTPMKTFADRFAGVSSMQLTTSEVISCDTFIGGRMPWCHAFTLSLSKADALTLGWSTTELAAFVRGADLFAPSQGLFVTTCH